MAGEHISDHSLMRRAYQAALLSPDPSTQNGAAISMFVDTDRGSRDALSLMACNELPEGIAKTKHRLNSKAKLSYIVHAERNAIYQAARCGLETMGRTMFSCWAPCSGCAQAIIQARIKRLVIHHDRMMLTPIKWCDEVELGLQMLNESGVEVTEIKGPVEAEPIRVNGRMWSPETLEFFERGVKAAMLDVLRDESGHTTDRT